MNQDERRTLIEGYLARLETALVDVPPEPRQELLEDVRGHIEEAWAASPERNRAALLGILDRLGTPEALAREERERLGLPPISPRSRCTPLIAETGTLSNRAMEWVLGIIGVAMVFASALFVWVSGPSARHWPVPALSLLAWVIFGLAGLLGIAFDRDGRSPRWGLLTWAAGGALLGSAILGLLEYGLFVLPAVLAIGSAAVLADRRRGRTTPRQLPLAVASGTASFLLILTTVMIAATLRPDTGQTTPQYPSAITVPARPLPTLRPGQVRVPNVIGMQEDEARRVIMALDLRAMIMSGDTHADDDCPVGHVCSQPPPPQASVPTGTTVGLVIRK